MSRRRVEDWRKVVLRTKVVSDSTRVLLLYLVEYMRADLTVSIPRSQIAQALGRNDRRIAERFNAAMEAGLLDRISVGSPGRTAVYIGTFPDHAKGADSSTHKGADGRTPWRPDKGADGGPAITTAKPSQGGHLGDVGSDDEQAGAPVGAHVTTRGGEVR